MTTKVSFARLTLTTSLVGLLIGCSGGPKDEPTAEQVAKGIESAFADLMPPQLGRRVDVTGWNDLTFTCTDVGKNVQRLNCETGGKVSIVGYENGVALQGGGVEIDAPFDLTFDKRADGWALSGYREKSK
ncbi:hypothetical protein [Luteimonas fraxinea]|uniref:Lipoprotein n=1 Tax=Luteimonas fraxinea TaxID=2901869 RepID=A0ABS8UD56_9GAMM|nr:hypothetical protein [Luteimonas fraxinea]MCD9096671.1 hypothetical protein [Luteimonas fraxinea]MCD9126041.1 hypothetical protein [Luteimonas fraxinea]